MGDISDHLLSMNLDDTDNLYTLHQQLEQEIFECDLLVKKLLVSSVNHTLSSDGSKGVKLPKIESPKFNGNIINWRSFWEQFEVSIHKRSDLSDAEKLVYLKNSLKDGSAKGVIEGLSQSGEFYAEAIQSLKARYDRPRLVHQTHVKMILEAPALKEGSGRELRRLHDTIQQHLRALKAMSYEPSGPFITSMLELKLDTNTMFEWQKFSHDLPDIPHYHKLLEFLDLRAQASEASTSGSKNLPKVSERQKNSHITSFTANATADSATDNCTLCKNEKHMFFSCPRFKALTHEKKLATLRSQEVCMNCLRPGHFVKQCRSAHRCRKCQKPHHTLLHVDYAGDTSPTVPPEQLSNVKVSANAISGLESSSLLMTCRVVVQAPDGSSIEARALLDSASSASFVSERLAQCLRLPRSRRDAKIFGVAGLSHESSTQVFTKFAISPVQELTKKINVTAVIVPRVTCDVPLQHIPFKTEWSHLADLTLADPDFGQPGKIDLLLGVDIFAEVVRQGRRIGITGTPSAFETDFGWVLAGETSTYVSHFSLTTFHTSLATEDDLLKSFWEIEEQSSDISSLSLEERSAVQHFERHHSRNESGQFIVPLPKRPQAKQIGESRSQAVRRFRSLEKSLHARGLSNEFNAVMEEYFEKDHAELVPAADLEKPTHEVFYLPMHVVLKESSSTTKVRAVFDASASSSTGVSLNDQLLVGPTVHSTLIDVLLRFRLHRIALTTDVSRMYRAVLLEDSDKDLHRFIWRQDSSQPLRDYRMTRITFGVSASSFVANMAVKQNAADFLLEYPLAARAVNESFYVDDGLTGADSIEEAITLQCQLQQLFDRGGFLLRKWNSSDPTVLKHIPNELKDAQSLCTVPDPSGYTKTLGIEWNTVMDHFRITIAKLPPLNDITKRFLISDVAKTFDILGWVSPCTIKMKILFQQLWEMKIDWDDLVPESIREAWMRWRSELGLLSSKHIPRCYYDKGTCIVSMELHGFSDASEHAYAAVVYLRMKCSDGSIQVALVSSKTKVAPIKKLTIPRLELCGAQLLAQLLHRVGSVLGIPLCQSYAWTDSTIVLSWLIGSPKRFRETESQTFLSYLVQIIGIMCQVLRIQQTVHRGVFFHLSSLITNCGGKVLIG